MINGWILNLNSDLRGPTGLNMKKRATKCTIFGWNSGVSKSFRIFAPLLLAERIRLSTQSTKCTFLGYAHDRKRFWCYDLNVNCIRISRNVVFLENQYFFQHHQDPDPSPVISFLLDFDVTHASLLTVFLLFTYLTIFSNNATWVLALAYTGRTWGVKRKSYMGCCSTSSINQTYYMSVGLLNRAQSWWYLSSL